MIVYPIVSESVDFVRETQARVNEIEVVDFLDVVVDLKTDKK